MYSAFHHCQINVLNNISISASILTERYHTFQSSMTERYLLCALMIKVRCSIDSSNRYKQHVDGTSCEQVISLSEDPTKKKLQLI